MPKTVKPDIRFVISTKASSFSGERNLELEAHLVVMTPDGVRYPQFGWLDELGAGVYEGLKVNAHLYPGEGQWIYDREPKVYGLYSIGLRRAESLERTLRRLSTKLYRLENQLGSPRDLPDFLARLAVACGATTTQCFGIRTRDGHTWDELGLQWVDTNSLQLHLDKTVNDWRA